MSPFGLYHTTPFRYFFFFACKRQCFNGCLKTPVGNAGCLGTKECIRFYLLQRNHAIPLFLFFNPQTESKNICEASSAGYLCGREACPRRPGNYDAAGTYVQIRLWQVRPTPSPALPLRPACIRRFCRIHWRAPCSYLQPLMLSRPTQTLLMFATSVTTHVLARTRAQAQNQTLTV